MIFGNTISTTYQFSFKQYNLFYTIQKHEIFPFMETVPHVSGATLSRYPSESCKYERTKLYIIFHQPNLEPSATESDEIEQVLRL